MTYHIESSPPLNAENNFVQLQFDPFQTAGFVLDRVVLQRILLQRRKRGFAGYDFRADAFLEAAVTVVDEVVDDVLFDQLRGCFKPQA